MSSLGGLGVSHSRGFVLVWRGTLSQNICIWKKKSNYKNNVEPGAGISLPYSWAENWYNPKNWPGEGLSWIQSKVLCQQKNENKWGGAFSETQWVWIAITKCHRLTWYFMNNRNFGDWEVQVWCWQVQCLEGTHLLVCIWHTSVMSSCGGKACL